MAGASLAAEGPAAGNDLVARLQELLEESLALWGIEAVVRRTGDGLTIETGPAGLLVRLDAANPVAIWWVGPPDRERPCPSVLDVMRAVRKAAG